MPRRATIRIAGTPAAFALWLSAGATSVPALAWAQDGAATTQAASSQALNGQATLNNVQADQVLRVDDASSGGATGQATAVGNTASALGQDGDLRFDSTQRYGGYMAANSGVIVGYSAGPMLANVASATGNTSTAGTCCGATTGQTTQTVDPGSTVYANAYASTGTLTEQVSVDSTAVGNTHGWEAANGSIQAASTQTNSGVTQAETGVNIQGGTSGMGGYSATAVANDVTVSATNTPVDLASTQTADGQGTRAALDVTQLGGDTVASQGTATGNNLTVATDGGEATVTDVQTNSGAVDVANDVKLQAWNTATVDSYGVGNSALLTNTGYATGITNTQTNTGAVTVAASLTGGAGGEGQVTATAVGNAVSAYACATCNGGVQATNNQVSSGPVRATATFTAGAVGSAVGAASAIGNTATFQVRSSGG